MPLPSNAPLSQGGPLDAPLYHASAVLKDGRVFVAGGEYNVVSQVDLLTTQIYDPVADSWTVLPTPPPWNNIGDAPSCVLPDGRVLLGDINSKRTAILDPITKTWSVGGSKDDNSSEESWTLLAKHSVLCAEVDNHPKAERYVTSSNTWVSAGSVPAASDLVLNTPVSIETGPAILMPDDRVFASELPGTRRSTTSKQELGPAVLIFQPTPVETCCVLSMLRPRCFRTAMFSVWLGPLSRVASMHGGRDFRSVFLSLTARP